MSAPGDYRGTPEETDANPPERGGAVAGRPLPVLLIVAVVATALAGFYLQQARNLVAPLYTDPVGPKAFPMLIAIGMLVSAVIMLLEYLQARRTGGPDAGSEQVSFSRTVPGVVAWTLVYFAAFEWLGYIVATALYVVPLMIVFNRRGAFVLNIAVGLAFCVASYLCLGVLLGAQLPTGTLFESLLY